MTNDSIQIRKKNLPNFDRMLSPDTQRRASAAVGERVVNYLSPYPRATEANKSPAPYYVRGRGTTYASGRNDGRSEVMSARWKVEAKPGEARVTNSASYSGYVSGLKQAKFHERRDWPSQAKYVKDQKEMRLLSETYLNVMMKAGGVK